MKAYKAIACIAADAVRDIVDIKLRDIAFKEILADMMSGENVEFDRIPTKENT